MKGGLEGALTRAQKRCDFMKRSLLGFLLYLGLYVFKLEGVVISLHFYGECAQLSTLLGGMAGP
jgi:hypothetical protein